jgi:virginiamycin B lyase
MRGLGRGQRSVKVAAKLCRLAVSAALLVAALLVVTGTAVARTQAPASEVTEFSLPHEYTKPGPVVAGPDGAIWFAVARQLSHEYSGQLEWRIARMTPAGKVGYFALPPNSAAGGVSAIADGPDGAIWYLTREAIGRITTSGQVTEFPHERVLGPLGNLSGAMGLGPDGSLWFIGGTPGMVVAPALDRVGPTGEVSEIPFSTNDSLPQAITWGPDGDVWFTGGWDGVIGHVSTAGHFIEFPVPGHPGDIVSGPGEVLWFASEEGIGRISTTGQLLPLVPFAGGARQIIAGPDGRLWFSGGVEGVIGRVSPSGSTSKIALQSSHRRLSDIATGPKGTVWFTADDDTPCEGGGGTCMAFEAIRKTAVVGSVTPAPPRTVVVPAGSAVHRHRAKLEATCNDGKVSVGCRGMIRLVVPNGPTLAKRRFHLAADETKAVFLSIGQRGRMAIAARGARRLIAITETVGGPTARRRLAILPS